MNARKKAFSWAMVGFSVLNAGCKPSEPKATGGTVIEAYYVPIGAQTLVPVTTEDIQQKGQECVIDSKEETDRIMKMLDAASPVPATGEGFSGKTVRVKLLEKSSHGTQLIAFVENEGFVKRADGRQGVLAAADLAALKKLIESHLK